MFSNLVGKGVFKKKQKSRMPRQRKKLFMGGGGSKIRREDVNRFSDGEKPKKTNWNLGQNRAKPEA